MDASEERFIRERIYDLSMQVDRKDEEIRHATELLVELATDTEVDPQIALQARGVLQFTGWVHFCHYCEVEVGTTQDHIVPLALGGLDVSLNKVHACQECNEDKADSYPEEHCEKCKRAITWNASNSLAFRRIYKRRGRK